MIRTLVNSNNCDLTNNSADGYYLPPSPENKENPSILIADAVLRQSQTSSPKPYTAYKIVVSNGISHWAVYRRYNEFYKLSETLKRDFPDIQLKLPGKKLFGNMRPVVIEERRIGLDDFVKQLLSNDSFLASRAVIDFLSLEGATSPKSKFLQAPPSPANGNSRSNSRNSSGDSFCGNSLENSLNYSYESQKNDKTSRNDSGYASGINEPDCLDLGPSERIAAKPDDFEFLKVIGKGSFGKVYLAKHRSEDQVYAVKVLRKNQIKKRNEIQHIMSERHVLTVAERHPFLVSLHYSFQTTDKLYFVLDYVNGGELFFHLQKERTFSENRARFYAAEIALAISYLHSKGIIYRDLKPENLLLDIQGHIRLTDFGLCKEGLDVKEKTGTFCGTPEYLAPEVLLKQQYDMSVDWWCFGCVLYEMLFALPPFYSRDHKEMYQGILNKPLQISRHVLPNTKDVLNRLLDKDPKTRLGAQDDVDEVKAHVFFASINWTELEARNVRPPYIPNLSGQLDTRNIDPEFTREIISESVGKPRTFSATVHNDQDDLFKGFSYVGPATLLV